MNLIDITLIGAGIILIVLFVLLKSTKVPKISLIMAPVFVSPNTPNNVPVICPAEAIKIECE